VVSRLKQRRSAAEQSTDSLTAPHNKPWVIEKAHQKPLLGVSQRNVQDTYGNILLVDDELNNLRVLSNILRSHGYKVRQALSGATALETIHAQPPDLIMLDVRMPNMDGYEVCALLKAQAATRDIPIVFLSALDDTPDKLKAFAVGGVDYITKPFQAEEVLVRIKNQLLILQQQRQLQEQNRQLQKEIDAYHQSPGDEIISYP
jgi:PleD family two-component response regulator